ncbi:SusC/RagA family TonB-linked outer membrane protein [Chitinophaga sp. MM2321]|uniref:SusC/RagA family TonB-linked outer membrane protein n=1 Tax=Chitinophaga sp. MM2321 TaxID=3137178 RepID=UPI0032D57BB1
MKKNYHRKYGLLCMFMLSVLIASAQTGRISGRAFGEEQQSLPGVTILLEGTNLGASSGSNGEFTINGIKPGTYTVRAQYIGYVTQSTAITVKEGDNHLDFNLENEASALNEVVVIGYGTQRKKDLTGAIATVTAADFNPGSITSPQQLISGKVAGVQVISSGGAPGAGSTIRIRAGASLNSSNDPLIVIDGVPLDNKGVAGLSNPLSVVNPNDIESFSILKDASAAAIYGSRASNGVIIITTKKGLAGGKLKVNINSLQSVSQKTGILDVLSADQYRTALTQYLDQTEADPAARQAKLGLMGNANTNWQNEIYQTAFKTDNTVSLSGGIKGLPYRLSLGYLNEAGILKTSDFDRVSGALNLSPKFFDNHLSVNANFKGTMTKSRFANTGAIGAAAAFNPTLPVYAAPYDPSQPESATNTNLGGYTEWVDNKGVPLQLAGKNPVSMLEQERNNANANRSIGNLQLDYKFHFLPELRANLNVGYDVSKSDGTDILPPTLAAAYTLKGTSSHYWQNRKNKLLDFYFNYVKDITSISSRIDVTAGYAYQDWIIDEPAIVIVSGIGNDPARNPTKTQNTLISYFGRVNYTFKDKYVLTGTIRTDGSSRFAPENRWGIFPSGAIAWDIKQESFLKESNALSQLKLRIGYGKTGQQDVTSNDYPYLAGYNKSDDATTYPMGGVYYNMLRPNAYDQHIKWEETNTFNTGIDFGFMDGRISGSVDYFIRKTNNLISRVVTATGSNFSNFILTNVGDMENKGIEFNLNATPVKTATVNWDLNFNLTHYDNKITNLTLSGKDDPTSPGTPAGATSFTGTSLQYHKVGYAPYTYYIQKQLYDAKGKPIEGSYADINGNGTSEETDFYHHKSPNPTLLLGLSSNLAYKKLSLGFTMRANLGAYNYNSVAANTGYGDALSFANFLANASGSINKTNFLHNRQTSDYYIENASFLRMDNLNLAYHFGKIGKQVDLTLSANVQNLFVVTGYSGLDPEVSNGIDNNFYPRPRIYSLGINLGL